MNTSVANTDGYGYELWKTDGTAGGTELVRDIRSGSSGSYPGETAVITGMLYFAANDGVDGEELWRSDGTSNGTYMVKNIRPDAASSEPEHLTPLSNTLFFAANDGTYGVELWRSDGTSNGTYVVSDIRSGASSSSPDYLVRVDDAVVFAATDGINGKELWRSDGTSNGTYMVRDIRPGPSGSWPKDLYYAFDEQRLFFSAGDGTHGCELWESDGTHAGTRMVADLMPGPYSSSPGPFAESGGRLYFAATTPNTGTELWCAMTEVVDSDGDGAPDWAEDVAGTGDDNSNSVFRVTLFRVQGNMAVLVWSSVAGRTYTVEAAPSLLGPLNFVELTNDVPATPPVNFYIDPSWSGEYRYYRVKARRQ